MMKWQIKDNATGTWRVIYRFNELERGTETDTETWVCNKKRSASLGT